MMILALLLFHWVSAASAQAAEDAKPSLYAYFQCANGNKAFCPFHWITVKDSNQIHQRYLTPYGNVVGEYYLPHKPTYPATYSDYPYVAQCFDGRPEAFAEEKQAKRFIEACKNSPE